VLLGLAVVLPVVIFVVGWYRSVRFQRLIASVDVQTLMLLQIGRVVGVVFLFLYAFGALPAVFALPAGLGDMLTGAAAPFLARRTASKTGSWQGALIAWNIFGMVDLLVAVSLGVLTSPSPLGVLAGATTSAPMATFPLSLIPTFLVPFYFMLHLITLRYARAQRN
jgi:hypothetical protein